MSYILEEHPPHICKDCCNNIEINFNNLNKYFNSSTKTYLNIRNKLNTNLRFTTIKNAYCQLLLLLLNHRTIDFIYIKNKIEEKCDKCTNMEPPDGTLSTVEDDKQIMNGFCIYIVYETLVEFLKYTKRKNQMDYPNWEINVIRNHLECSRKEAIDALDMYMLTEGGMLEIREILVKWGIDEAKIEELGINVLGSIGHGDY